MSATRSFPAASALRSALLSGLLGALLGCVPTDLQVTPGEPGQDGKPGPAGERGRDGRDGQDGRDGEPAPLLPGPRLQAVWPPSGSARTSLTLTGEGFDPENLEVFLDGEEVEVASATPTRLVVKPRPEPTRQARTGVLTVRSGGQASNGLAFQEVPRGTPSALELPVLRSPRGAAFSADGGTLYVADRASGLLAIDVASRTTRILKALGPDLHGPRSLALHPGTGELWLVDSATPTSGSRLLRFNPRTGELHLELMEDGEMGALAFDEAGALYLGYQTGGDALVLRADGQIGLWASPGPVESLAVANGALYLSTGTALYAGNARQPQEPLHPVTQAPRPHALLAAGSGVLLALSGPGAGHIAFGEWSVGSFSQRAYLPTPDPHGEDFRQVIALARRGDGALAVVTASGQDTGAAWLMTPTGTTQLLAAEGGAQLFVKDELVWSTACHGVGGAFPRDQGGLLRLTSQGQVQVWAQGACGGLALAPDGRVLAVAAHERAVVALDYPAGTRAVVYQGSGMMGPPEGVALSGSDLYVRHGQYQVARGTLSQGPLEPRWGEIAGGGLSGSCVAQGPRLLCTTGTNGVGALALAVGGRTVPFARALEPLAVAHLGPADEGKVAALTRAGALDLQGLFEVDATGKADPVFTLEAVADRAHPLASATQSVLAPWGEYLVSGRGLWRVAR